MPQFQAGWATLTGLKRQFERLRQAKKRVVTWLPEGGGNRGSICGAADEVLISPQAGFGPLGLVASVRYLRPALDRLGVELHVEARHEFKTAMEPYVRDSMSDAQREQTDALFGAFDNQLDRRWPAAELTLMPRFLGHDPQAAVDAGFADGLAYEDELRPRYLADEKQSFQMHSEVRALRLATLETSAPPTLCCSNRCSRGHCSIEELDRGAWGG